MSDILDQLDLEPEKKRKLQECRDRTYLATGCDPSFGIFQLLSRSRSELDIVAEELRSFDIKARKQQNKIKLLKDGYWKPKEYKNLITGKEIARL